jgi:hypothetical protein
MHALLWNRERLRLIMNINIFIKRLVIPFIIIILNWQIEIQYVNDL